MAEMGVLGQALRPYRDESTVICICIRGRDLVALSEAWRAGKDLRSFIDERRGEKGGHTSMTEN